jgi:hypothetical protein
MDRVASTAAVVIEQGGGYVGTIQVDELLVSRVVPESLEEPGPGRDDGERARPPRTDWTRFMIGLR